MRYLVQPKCRIFVKNYGLLSLAKNMGKNIGKNNSEKLSGKYGPGMLAICVRNFLIMLNNLQQMQLKLLQKESFKKQQKELVI